MSAAPIEPAARPSCWACGKAHDGLCQRDDVAAVLGERHARVANEYADAVEQQLRASLEAEGVDVDELLADNGGVQAYGPRELVEDLEAAADERADQADADADAGGEDLETYAAMFAQYLDDQRLWIGPQHRPLVHHIKALCRRLDSDPEASASMSSSYLQAITRLERMRPGSAAPRPGAGDALGGQTSIFDELDG